MTKTKKTVLIVVVSVLVLVLSSVAAYAATNVSEIEELYLAFRTAQANAAVESGEITQEEADELLTDLEERMNEDETDAVPSLQGESGMSGMSGNAIEAYAEMIGEDVDTLRETLESEDLSLFAYADEQGDLDDLKAAMIEKAATKIDQAVENGKIDEEEAEDMKTNIAERINEITADTVMQVGSGKDNGSMGGQHGRKDGDSEESEES